MLIDKKKAEKGKWRIQEKTIFIITALGGGIGTISGMYVFRHKTKKWQFTLSQKEYTKIIRRDEIIWM